MASIIQVERKRILNKWVLILFFILILSYSINSSYHGVNSYLSWGKDGIKITATDNLSNAKTNSQGIFLDEALLISMAEREAYTEVYETNTERLVAINYGKRVQDLSIEDRRDFYSQRLYNIQEILDTNSNREYSDIEKAHIFDNAKKLSVISLEYAEGWKVLNNDYGKFMQIVLILIAFALLPLFGSETQSKMKDLYHATKYGKERLNRVKVIVALQVGTLLYFLSSLFYFIIKMIPFGLEGADLLIQSNVTTFYSVYNISFLQQFFLNVLIAYVAMLYMICLTLLASVLLEGVMTGAVAITFYWILLLVFDQMKLYPLNHWLANFTPLRMTDFIHYYNQNEVYRVFGKSITSMSWVITLVLILSTIIFILSLLIADRKCRGWKIN